MLQQPNDEKYMCDIWDEFLDEVTFEQRIVQRELEFYQRIGKSKTLSEFLIEKKEFFDKYLQKCISFHSKIQIQNFIQNVDGFLRHFYEFTKVPLAEENRKRLHKKLQCFEIPIDCSGRVLNHLEMSAIREISNNFLPSKKTDIEEMRKKSERFENILGDNRWIVVLGDPGSAKTSLLRWVTYIFAEAASHMETRVQFDGEYSLPLRIPILIRIGEFAEWLNQSQTKSLLDYIGQHTWFAERYCNDGKDIEVLKQLIYQGHCLILLDGLDEVSNLQQKNEIIDYIRKFTDEYVLAPDFISASDHTHRKEIIFDVQSEEFEAFFPKRSGFNQLIITSRSVGYLLHPVNDRNIHHYILNLFDFKQANEFTDKLLKTINESIYNILSNEGIQITLAERYYIEEISLEFESTYSPSFLSLICMSRFQSPSKINPKLPIQIYYHTVQMLFNIWKSKDSTIPKCVLHTFLMDLACYLYTHSPSGLIDTFDIQHLCSLSLKQQKFSSERKKLSEYTMKILSLLESTNVIFAEKGLNVFGFLHLSIQKYFVVQALVKGNSVENVVKRIMSFCFDSRFHQVLVLAISWISWMWTVDKYNEFCKLSFIQSNYESRIPFGTLLFFKAFDHIYKLPENCIIFHALNSILNHPYDEIRQVYLIKSLSQLPNDMIIEWMRVTLQDEECLRKFCQCLRTAIVSFSNLTGTQWIPSIVCQQLWAFSNENPSTAFIINQTLRYTLKNNKISEQIFNHDLCTYLSTEARKKYLQTCSTHENVDQLSKIHPLILSVIITVYGGLDFIRENYGSLHITFNPLHMHTQSNQILTPLLEYLNNKIDSHSIKIDKIVQQYENIIKQSSLSDTSIEIIDTFIALICLQGVLQPSTYEKYENYQALPLALEKFKHVWFYSMDRYANWKKNNFYSTPKITISRTKIELIMRDMSLKFDQSQEKVHSVLVACESAWKKLFLRSRNKSGAKEVEDSTYFQYYPEFQYLTNDEYLQQLHQRIHSSNFLQTDPSFMLNFLPQSLQQLYYHTILSPTDETDSLPLELFLIQCLLYLEDIDVDNLYSFLILPVFELLFKQYGLENYALILFSKIYHSNIKSLPVITKNFLEQLKNHHLLDSFLEHSSLNNWELLINEERQRIAQNRHLYSASICLARLFQIRYSSQQNIHLNSTESTEVYLTLMNIEDPILQIHAIHIILNMKQRLILSEEQRDELRWYIINQLNNLLPNLSLLKSTFLFIHCYSLQRIFPSHFQHFANVIGEKHHEIPPDRKCSKQNAVYIALRHLNDTHLFKYLAKFAKEKENISTIVRFNSSVFYQYFLGKTSFQSLDPLLLSAMYLMELFFDAQILHMYTLTTKKPITSPMSEVKQWCESSRQCGNILTFEMALSITNYISMLDNNEIEEIIQHVFKCNVIERKTLPIIAKWFSYRMNKDLRYLAYYAAVQSIVEGSTNSCVIDIMEEIFKCAEYDRLIISIIERFFTSNVINLSILRQTLIKLHQYPTYLSRISSAYITRREILDLILSLEHDRISSHIDKPSKLPTKSFLLPLKDCSNDLLNYLTEHLQSFTNIHKDTYIAVVIKWIIEQCLLPEVERQFPINLFNNIFILLHDHQIPQIQKAILNGFNTIFSIYRGDRKVLYKENDIVISLESIIHSWNEYSKDVLALCLLTYGNCLLRLQRLDISRNISDEIILELNEISEISPSEIISIRAKFCLLFLQQMTQSWNTLTIWFREDSNLTDKNLYEILRQQLLYKINEKSFCRFENKFVVYLNTKNKSDIIGHISYRTDLIDLFIIDLYNYLSSQQKNDYLSDPIPDYIELAEELCWRMPDRFCDAVRKNSSIGEEAFKASICIHYQNHRFDDEASLKLYCIFRLLTNDILEMVKCIRHDRFKIDLCLRDLNELSGHDVIEELFQLMQQTSSYFTYGYLKIILEHIIKINAVSLIEVFENISVTHNVPYSDRKTIIHKLLEMSCLKEDYVKLREKFIDVTDINEEFEKEIQLLDKTLRL
ncbi:unnamed protein product [Adineta steineri]|uniref:NACHT domain-containing protein n=1 Tax=Adineta steineri TaxID=433720 RepID=A0A815K9T8_9BILA|nr:unnamed protein product [Adineta steineri]CAF3818537.1 unnamed protein product [Adineta steineri]